MDPRTGNGKTNQVYEHSNGTINIPNRQTRNHSLPNGSLNNYNDKVPFDRMGSTLSSQYNGANSVLKLVIDDSAEKKIKKILCCRLKHIYCVLIVILLIVIGVFASLYIKEWREKSSQNLIQVKTQFNMRVTRTIERSHGHFMILFL